MQIDCRLVFCVGLLLLASCGRSTVGLAEAGEPVAGFGALTLQSVHAEDALTCDAADAYFDGSRFLVSGQCASNAQLDDWRVWAYDPETDTWETLDTFRSTDTAQMFATAVTTSSLGGIFAGGYAVDGGASRRFVRASRDGGTTWQTVDNPTAQNGTLSDMASVGGAVLAIATTTSSNGGWVVRRSTDQGNTWYDVDIRGAGTQGTALSILDNGLYATGLTRVDQPTVTSWTVRYSSDFGVSWSTVGDYFSAGGGSLVSQVFEMPDNDRLFVAGSWTTASTWRVSSSADRTSWRVDDNYTPSDGLARMRGGVINHSSNQTLLLGGVRQDASSAAGHALIRGSTNGTRWTTVATGVADGDGNVIGEIVGGIELESGELLLITRYGPTGTGQIAAVRVSYGL